MRSSLVLGFVLLVACAKSPTAPDPSVEIEEPTPEPIPEPKPDPLTPEEGRALLQEAGVPYSQASFLSAAGAGDRTLVEAFVAAGMDVNVQNEDEGYDTALMRASAQGHLEVVQYLLSEEANSNLTNGRCAGHIAFPDLAVEARDCAKQTAVMWAAHGGHLDIVRALVEEGRARLINYGAWIVAHEGPDTPLMLAAAAGHLDIVEYLVPHVSSRLTSMGNYGTIVDGGRHALMWAAYGGHQAVAAFLLTQGSGSGKIEINPPKPLGAVRGEGYAPLHFAAIAGQTEMVRFLLDRGADIHVRVIQWYVVWNNRGTRYSTFKGYQASALTLAAGQGHIETLRVLLDHWVLTYGADGRDDHGRTTLMYAAAAGDTDTMAALVAEGAPVNAQTHTGATALMFAAAEGHADAVVLLLEMGADTSAANNNNDTALILAQENGHEAIVEMLEG